MHVKIIYICLLVDGVNNVCVDLARGSVEVIYNSPATPLEIKQCIENTGHPVH